MKIAAIAAAALLSMPTLTINDYVPMVSIGRAHAQESIQEMVSRKAADHGVPERFAHAVVKVESNYDPKLRGSHGEYGLGQIKCSTARDVGFTGKCQELAMPEINLEFSMRYLSEALKVADGNLCGASTVYNAGLNHKPTKSKYCRMVLSQM